MHYLKKLKTISRYSLLLILFIIFSIFITLIRIKLPLKSEYSNNTDEITGVVESITVSKNNSRILLKGKEKILVYLNNADYEIGDYIKIRGNIKVPNNNKNFNVFNYNLYLKSMKINYIFYGQDSSLISKNNNLIYKIRKHLVNKIDKYKYKSYFYALILGNQSYIENDIKNVYSFNGISHLFAISGTHISILIIILKKILEKFKLYNLSKNILVLFILLFYVYVINFPISVTRTILLYLLITLKKYSNINIKNYILLIILFCLFILYNPFIIYNIGFQFSFMISFSLLICSEILKKRRNKILSSLLISLISFVSGIIITIQNFHVINLFTPIFNLFYVPFVSLIIYPTMLLSLIFKKIENILNIEIYILEYMGRKCMNISLPFSISLAHLSLLGIIFYIFLIIVIYLFIKKEKYYIFLILLPIFIIHNNIRLFFGNDTVTMIDVGQGDSFLITYKYKTEAVLIDTGGKINNSGNISKNTIIPYLNSIGIKSIKFLILTHGDLDHIGDSASLVKHFKVKNVVFNNDEFNSLEQNLINILKSKKIKYYKNLKELSINNMEYYFLNTKQYDNENDNSNVIYFSSNNYKFLFMGDASSEKEMDIVKKYNIKNIDFLKVGHHGSDTSSSTYFINKIIPKNCLISVGFNNRYGHPKKNVLNILKNCNIYRTDISGSIKITLYNNKYKIETY